MARNRLGILISGRGSNMQAIVEACARGRVPADVALVVSNRAAAEGLRWAEDRGLPTSSCRTGTSPTVSAMSSRS